MTGINFWVGTLAWRNELLYAITKRRPKKARRRTVSRSRKEAHAKCAIRRRRRRRSEGTENNNLPRSFFQRLHPENSREECIGRTSPPYLPVAFGLSSTDDSFAQGALFLPSRQPALLDRKQNQQSETTVRISCDWAFRRNFQMSRKHST